LRLKEKLNTLSGVNSDLKTYAEDLEHFILGTSETVNEKIEEIQR
jgi:hypothetical protein